MLFGWLHAREHDASEVIDAIAAALRVHDGQQVETWLLPGLAIGRLTDAAVDQPAPASDGRYTLWMAGEVFDGPRQIDLLTQLVAQGPSAIRDLNGEYQLALWDAQLRRLVLMTDRFGALPLYFGRSSEGAAFAGGVRGVLMAPGIPCEPDLDALREAVTFGGFRLGSRTNVTSVRMVPGAAALTATALAEPRVARYWHWADLPAHSTRPLAEVVAELRETWRLAIAARLGGASRPGLTLSGGLDSRAILAEASAQGARLQAITYGVADCDDAVIARTATQAAGAEWVWHPLYGGPDWLDRRIAHIQATDGLIELVDLMHLEALPVIRERVDVLLSGYIGDAVTGPTFNEIHDARDAVLALPYYGGRLSLPWDAVLERAEAMIAELRGAPARFALFEHKLPQSTNRLTAALRPWVRVRRPFVDYRVFDLAQGQPPELRRGGALHEHWLRSTYPECFARIAHQKTGVPILTPTWRRQVMRIGRYGWRRSAEMLRRAGLPVRVRRRSYHADDRFWREPAVRRRIESVVLRQGSLAVEAFGRAAVEATLADWFDRLAQPTQVIGALYVFDAYHRDLSATLRAARAAARAGKRCSFTVC